MSVRVYKVVSLILVCVVVWCAWNYWSFRGQVLSAAFIMNQGDHLRVDIETANSGVVVSRNAGALSDRDLILADLKWYLDYYDHRTNALAGSTVLPLVRRQRLYVVRDAISYLRQTSTNDFGDDPYEWLKRANAQ
jgi:hypothetical protein